MKAKSGDDTGDDTNDVVMEDSKSKQQKEKKKEPLLICGDRKRDVRNGNATILHCCDYNPVSGYWREDLCIVERGSTWHVHIFYFSQC